MYVLIKILNHLFIIALVLGLHLGVFWFFVQFPAVAPQKNTNKPMTVQLIQVIQAPVAGLSIGNVAATTVRTTSPTPAPSQKTQTKPKIQTKPVKPVKSKLVSSSKTASPPPEISTPSEMPNIAANRSDSAVSSPKNTTTSKTSQNTSFSSSQNEIIQPPRFNAAYLKNPPPNYPLAARRRGETGTVLLRVHVSAQGLPLQVEIHKSSGVKSLDKAAEKVLHQWRFTPAKRGHETIAQWVTVPIKFDLE